MTQKAAQRAEWGARITNEDWGTHPTIAYGVMYSAAFFEEDVNKLVAMALEAFLLTARSRRNGHRYDGAGNMMTGVTATSCIRNITGM